MAVKFTILGCGSSSGVPRITGDWGICDPNEPKNRRRRCAMLVQKTTDQGITTLLIDTGADIHHQLIDVKFPRLDAVLMTHEHADHTHGIDDLRAFAQDTRQQIPVYMSDHTFAEVGVKFSYCFKQVEGSYYPAILKRMKINYGQAFCIDGAGGMIEILPIKVTHGSIDATAFLIEGVMYSADVSDIPKDSLYAFEGLGTWVIDSLRPRPHVSHFGLEDALKWIDRMRPTRAILTNMTGELDYQSLKAELAMRNQNIAPAYDGMVFSV